MYIAARKPADEKPASGHADTKHVSESKSSLIEKLEEEMDDLTDARYVALAKEEVIFSMKDK